MSQASFRAYVDESGDEGFKFRSKPGDTGSSDWFVLTALVSQGATDAETVKIIDRIREEFDLHPRKHVHWLKLKHQQKVRYSQVIAGLQVSILSVCVHKPSLVEREKFEKRYNLYFYTARYLMERLSWLARDYHAPQRYGGDGTLDVQFSNRQGMSCEEMKSYLRLLESRKKLGHDIRIDFDYVKITQLSTQTPGRSMGLQLADAAAGATFNALERDRYGNTEPRYFQTLRPVVYSKHNRMTGYGLKILPREALANMSARDEYRWLADS